jgi:hypothetical protein
MDTRSAQGAPLLESFASILVADVAAVMQRFDLDQSQQVRREMIRTLFAAIEGYAWLYREHVIEAAQSMTILTREEEAALSDVSYQVSEQGKISKQPRHLSVLAAFRLTTRIATRLNSNLAIRFDTDAWERLRAAILIRNRITHPKRRSDLEISDQDLMTAQTAFFWLLDTAVGAMEAANVALRQYNADFRATLADLRNGNPTVWEEYRKAIDHSWNTQA